MSVKNPLKLVVFGEGGVGKSSIVLRFITDTFTCEYLPTIEDCYRKNCTVDGKAAFLDILDTAGQEEYHALRDQWVHEGRAFLLVYSVIERKSLEKLPMFIERIMLVKEDEGKVPMVLVGNKIDRPEEERQVSTEEGQKMAQKWGDLPFIECSAAMPKNCDEVFHEAVREIRKLDKSKGKEVKHKEAKSSFWSKCVLL